MDLNKAKESPKPPNNNKQDKGEKDDKIKKNDADKGPVPGSQSPKAKGGPLKSANILGKPKDAEHVKKPKSDKKDAKDRFGKRERERSWHERSSLDGKAQHKLTLAPAPTTRLEKPLVLCCVARLSIMIVALLTALSHMLYFILTLSLGFAHYKEATAAMDHDGAAGADAAFEFLCMLPVSVIIVAAYNSQWKHSLPTVFCSTLIALFLATILSVVHIVDMISVGKVIARSGEATTEAPAQMLLRLLDNTTSSTASNSTSTTTTTTTQAPPQEDNTPTASPTNTIPSYTYPLIMGLLIVKTITQAVQYVFLAWSSLKHWNYLETRREDNEQLEDVLMGKRGQRVALSQQM